jgi:hypothetical protein
MKTLVLGHTYNYKKTDVRCCPIDVDLWYDKPFDCVDCRCDKEETTFTYDIYRSIDYRFEKIIRYKKLWVWKFAENNSYDIIIDCIGLVPWIPDRKSYGGSSFMEETILRVLRINGIFYSYAGIYTKITDETLSFEPKKLYGFRYVD